MNKNFFLLPVLALTLACLGAPTLNPAVESPTSSELWNPLTPILPTGVAGVTAGVTRAVPPPVILHDLLNLQVVFVQSGRLFVWSQPTGARPLAVEGDAGEVRLSDDGAVVVYQRGQTLWAVNVRDATPRLLVDVATFSGNQALAQFEIQPRTHTVYFATFSTQEFPSVGNPPRDLRRVDADAPAPQTLLTDGGGYFTFSPDGNLIALAQTHRINTIHADGSALTTAFTFDEVNTGADWAYVPQVVWLADSSGLYTVIPARDIIANPAEKSRFLYIPAAGGFNAQLAEFVAADVRLAKPLIAPNGSKVAYVTQDAGALTIHVIDASTADAPVATYPDAGSLTLWAWSPDSTRLAFWERDPAQTQLTGIGLPALLLVENTSPYSLAWVTPDIFLYFANGALQLGQVGTPSLLVIASGFAPEEQNSLHYDFAK